MKRRPERRFWFQLALALGMSVREAQEKITSREFVEWMAFYRLEPWGEWRGDYQAGMVCSTVANIVRKKGSGRYKPSDFIPKFGESARKQQSAEHMKQLLFSFATAHNAR